MDTVGLYLAQIPASFWGVVFGSFFSIFAVWLSNRASEKRLQAQFLHEQTIKAKERELTLKKDIYLPVSEAISTGFSTLVRLSDLNLSHENVFLPFQEKLPLMARVHVVGGMETIRAISDLTGTLNAEILRLRVTRDQLLNERQALHIEVDAMTRLGNKRDEIFEELSKYRIEQPLNKLAHKSLEDRYEFEAQRTKVLLVKVKDAQAELKPKHASFVRECVEASLKMNALRSAALAAVRAELELPFDGALYEEIAEKNRTAQVNALKGYHEAIAG
jgi:hypothetical protein